MLKVFSFTFGFRSTSVSLGLDVPDSGQAVEGTKCGDNKVAWLGLAKNK